MYIIKDERHLSGCLSLFYYRSWLRYSLGLPRRLGKVKFMPTDIATRRLVAVGLTYSKLFHS
ncbi:MAG: hypothetical protein OXU73_00795, partial [Candidatus Campbellbacteria bacterium]|nr:hypothetical protein [Candidatus Campbellbacteria bacterium]